MIKGIVLSKHVANTDSNIQLFCPHAPMLNQQIPALIVTFYQTKVTTIKKIQRVISAPQQIASFETEGPQLVFAEAVGGHL